MDKENKSLEYKETISKTYLKTVSAFSNYGDGSIIFGISDDYKIIGIKNPTAECLNIENQINDSIKPKPFYSLRVNDDNTITLSVKKGYNTPYRYNGKAYIRNDSSTIECDDFQERRLVLEGENLNFEELPSKTNNLGFEFLGKKLSERLGLASFNLDILKSLNLYSEKDGYNNAAALLADKNDFPGIDIVVFGEDINVFKRRYTFEHISILEQYFKSLDVFENECVSEKIEGGFRKRIESVPLPAFRESVANALIHRTWDVSSNIKVEIHPSKVIVSSPGGLVSAMSKEDFLIGSFSYLRNPIIAEVFHRLDIVEKFATGIRRINSSYSSNISKPSFVVTSGSISVILPYLNSIVLSPNERNLYFAMQPNINYSSKDLVTLSSLSKATLIRTINSLIDKKLLSRSGEGRNITYLKVRIDS